METKQTPGVNWGYRILDKGRSIDFDTNDLSAARQLQEAEKLLNSCIGCGACSATCTAGNLTTFNFRKLHTLIRRGEYHQIKQEIDKCMLCGKCVLVCPRGINTRRVIVTIKRLCHESIL